MADTTTQQNWQILWQALTADVTDFDASTTQHGFEAKGTGDVTKFRRADNTWAVPPYPTIKKYKSPQQTITSGGSLTLPHGFVGVDPTDIETSVILICQTAEFNYSIGDIIVFSAGADTSGATTLSAAIIPDATNLNIRYSNAATVFVTLDKTTHAQAALTNANWKVIFRAWV